MPAGALADFELAVLAEPVHAFAGREHAVFVHAVVGRGEVVESVADLFPAADLSFFAVDVVGFVVSANKARGEGVVRAEQVGLIADGDVAVDKGVAAETGAVFYINDVVIAVFLHDFAHEFCRRLRCRGRLRRRFFNRCRHLARGAENQGHGLGARQLALGLKGVVFVAGNDFAVG